MGCCLGPTRPSYSRGGVLVEENLTSQALFNLANLQRQCGEFEDAVKSYERVVALSPDSWRGLLNYSVALVGLGREAEAKQALRRAFRLSGDSLHRC